MVKIADKIAEKQQADRAKPTSADVIEVAGDLMGAIALAHDLPVDFDGVTISILREPGTNRLLGAIISPVDMYGDEPFARYQVSLDSPAAAAKKPERSIILPSG